MGVNPEIRSLIGFGLHTDVPGLNSSDGFFANHADSLRFGGGYAIFDCHGWNQRSVKTKYARIKNVPNPLGWIINGRPALRVEPQHGRAVIGGCIMRILPLAHS